MYTRVSPETANDRFKEQFSGTFWYSVAGAVVLHAAVLAFWPTMSAADVARRTVDMNAVELPDELVIPPAPEEIARPAAPIPSTADSPDEFTIAPTTFEMFTPERLPSPPQTTETDPDLSRVPVMLPRTVEPELLNRAQVEQSLVRNYPPILRESGIGGMATVWFFIDEDGRVQRRMLSRRSGYDALDEAALKVAEVMRFSPAMNRDRKVPVWVEVPIIFRTK